MSLFCRLQALHLHTCGCNTNYSSQYRPHYIKVVATEEGHPRLICGMMFLYQDNMLTRPCSPLLLKKKKKKKPLHQPFKLSDKQYGAGDAQSHERQRVDDRFNKGQACGDSRQDANDHFEP